MLKTLQSVQELTAMNTLSLKPLVVMSDYQPDEAMGAAFEAQHALLWSSAQFLHPILVSVWDQEMYKDVRVKISKDVHVDTLGSVEINAAFLVALTHIKVSTSSSYRIEQQPSLAFRMKIIWSSQFLS